MEKIKETKEAISQENKEIVNIWEELSNFMFVSKYSKYNEHKKRRETWDETVDRSLKMHLNQFFYLEETDKEKIKWAFDMVRQKRVVPSMRGLQFGGKAIEAHNCKLYNCSVRHIDSIRAFAEVMYLLLNGCGVGIGLSKYFLSRLPNLVDANDKTGTIITYVVDDTIEGWADSVEALLNCFFKNTAYTGRKIVFDYSRIRKKGALLRTSGGKAPGYKGLKAAHIKIKTLLDHIIIEELSQKRMKSINAYDIVMHCSDAVLSGGVRRSACAVMFDLDDMEMMNAKTYFSVDKASRFVHDKELDRWCGKVTIKHRSYDVELEKFDWELLQKEKKISWFYIEPQRARSNNSVLLLRDKITLEDMRKIVKRTREFGEPGFVFANHEHQLFNPCQPAFAPVITKDGLKKMGDIKTGDYIWSETGWTKVINKWSTGVKKVCAYRTTAGVFYGTEKHRIVSEGKKIEIGVAESIDILVGPNMLEKEVDPQTVLDGLVLGDGTRHMESANRVGLIIGQNDYDYFNSEISYLIGKKHGMHKLAWNVNTTLGAEEIGLLPNRIIPERYVYNSSSKVASFLRGLYSANGSICGDRITLKTTSFKLVEQVQIMLSSLGIKSYYTINKASTIHWKNGDYESKESYDLNITTDRVKFKKNIGFLQSYKNEKLENIISESKRNGSGRKTHDIISQESLGAMEVFDISVDNDPHTYWTGGLNVSNCFEANFIPVTSGGVCGVQMCNLTSINGSKVKTQAAFKECVEAATIIGTLQACYTNFPYLGNASKELTEEEALLGVSITGFMDSPEILLNPEKQKEAAKHAIAINKEWAIKLGINQAARITLAKPEGSSSLFLGCASGIHAHHSKQYFRRIQCNKIDNIYRYFKKHNPHLCEESVWSANKTDDCITFPLQPDAHCMVKGDLSAIKHLEIIKSTQQNWVISGTTEANKKPITHNISCTVIVKDDEWDEVTKYLYENRDFFSAVSLLSFSSDKSFAQAPNEDVSTEEDKKKFKEYIDKFKHVDYTKLIEEEDDTKLQQEISCAGGFCEIIK